MLTKLISFFAEGPQYVIPGWQIKRNNSVKTPVGVIAEPIGGPKNEHGRNQDQEDIARLMTAAPELLETLKGLVSDIECATEIRALSINHVKELIELVGDIKWLR